MLVEMVVIVALAVGAGLAFNAWRPDSKKRVILNKAYFDIGSARDAPQSAPSSPIAGLASRAINRPASQPAPADTSPAHKHPQHGWQVIAYDDLAALANDPNTQGGGNMIVDARKPELYEKGHIPWAIRIYPDYASEELPTYLERLMNADKIVVYCNGGDCEDSIFMCRELDHAGVAYAKIFLYEGGYHEWTEKQQPTHTGSEP
jgi:rhodanese-related sulfurtransferase